MFFKSNVWYFLVDFIVREWYLKKLNNLVKWEIVILKVIYNLKLVFLLFLFFYVLEFGKIMFNLIIFELIFNRFILGILSNICLFFISNNKGWFKVILYEVCKVVLFMRRFK